MFNDISCFKQIYLCSGYTDLRCGIDGLASLVQNSFQLDPTLAGSVFLFCGRKTDRIKALYYDGDGWVLLYKRFAGGKLCWPRNTQEARELTLQQYRWLMEGLAIEQEKAIKNVKPALY